MWARICEIILAVWLVISYFAFEYHSVEGVICAVLILIFALLSYIDKLNKMHLCQIIPTGWLIYLGFVYPTPWIPMGLQNYIVVAVLLLMFTIIPSNASDHPRPWKRFLKKLEDEEHQTPK